MARIPPFLSIFASSRTARVVALSVLWCVMLASLGASMLRFSSYFPAQVATATIGPDSTAAQAMPAAASKQLLGLFGTHSTAPDAGRQPLEKLPESSLNLLVSAIFYRPDASQSSVILEDGDRTLILKAGDEARPGILVQQIDNDRITLKRNGKLEQISFRGFADSDKETAGLSRLPTSARQATRALSGPAPRAPARAAASLASSDRNETSAPGASAAYQNYIQRKLAQTKQ